MALPARTGSQSLTYRTLAVSVLSALTYLLYLWPKYAAFTVGPARVSGYYLVILLAIGVSFGALVDRRTRPRLTVFGGFALAFFMIHYAARYVSAFYGPTASDSAYSDTRELIWSGSLFVIGILLGHWPDTLPRTARQVALCMLVVTVASVIETALKTTFPAFILSHLPVSVDETFKSELLFDKSRDGSFRAQALFFHPIVFGEVSAASAPVILALWFSRRRMWLPLFAFFGCVLCVVLSGSRGGQIGLIVGLLAYAGFYVLMRRSAMLWVTALLTIPITGAIGVTAYNYALSLVEGRTATEQGSTQIRRAQWDRGTPSIQESPLLGYGAGNSVLLAGIKGRTHSLTIDDYYLTVLLDYGIVGAVTLGMMIMCVALGSIASRPPPSEQIFHAAYLAGISVIVVCQHSLSIPEGIAFAMLFAGLLVANQARVRQVAPYPIEDAPPAPVPVPPVRRYVLPNYERS